MSKKRVIAIDFDDVIIDTMIPFLKHYEKAYGVTVGPEHAYVPDSPAWDVDLSEVVVRAEHFHSTEQRANTQFVAGAQEAIQKLAETCELHIITGRPNTIADMTKEMIELYFPNTFKSVNFTGIFATTNITKSSVCKQLQVDFFIDDHIKHAIDVADAGIETVLFGSYPWNQVDSLPDNIRRVHGWDEVLEIVEG